MIAPPPLLAALAPLALVLAGVACTPAQNRQDVLLRSVHEYNDGVRWKKYERVMHHLSPEEARRFATRAGTFLTVKSSMRMPRSTSFHVTGVETVASGRGRGE